jgi:protocatechuate 3,4-dioxygenase alpha subunit
MAGITPSQTVGPFFHYGLTPHDYDFGAVFGNNLVTPEASGERIRIEGRVLDGDGQAPHIAVVVFSRGMLRQVYTRIYFSDEATTGADPILALVPADRRGTLIARRADRGGQAVYAFDIRIQGDGETVFFDI